MEGASGDERFKSIVSQLRAGKQPPMPTVRDLLSWFGVQRRGNWIVRRIRQALRKAGLQTEPDFQSAYIGTSIQFVLRSKASERERPTADIRSLDEAVLQRIEKADDQAAIDASPVLSVPDTS